MQWWISIGDTSDGSKFIFIPLKSEAKVNNAIATNELSMIDIIELVNPVLTGRPIVVIANPYRGSIRTLQFEELTLNQFL
jgi:uncharacterized protein YvpB